MITRLSFIIYLMIEVCVCVEVSRPRGVALTKIVFYNSETNFTCLDGTQVFPFTYVNDDFCDCGDGTDEPGTSACPNGIFHCTNAGHKPQNIPSSRVNDGVCDCCDATDEYDSSILCVNVCRDLGRKAREDAVRMAEIVNKGVQIRLEMSAEGKRKKEERRTRLEELEKLKEAAESFKAEKEKLKNDAEEFEKAALDKYKSEEEEKKKLENEQKQVEKDKEDATLAFAELDQDDDGLITVSEIQAKWVFDSNKDGIITEDEAKFFLNNEDSMDRDAFLQLGWLLMKPHYSMLGLFKGPEETEEAATTEAEEPESTSVAPEPQIEVEAPVEEAEDVDDDEDIGEDDEDVEDEDLDKLSGGTPKEEQSGTVTEGEEEVATPSLYDAETQQLIDVADAARKEYDEANKHSTDLQTEINDLKHVLDLDVGEEDQFAPLHGQCYEYIDREYIYKLCPFDQTSQRPKSGGGDINLGKWKSWSGGEGSDTYSRMKYDHGLTCWNGPARSTEVALSCGVENKVVSVSEPNKCVYRFDFETPAVCKLSSESAHDQQQQQQQQHEEL